MTQALKEYDQIVALASCEFFATMVQVWFTQAILDEQDQTMAQKVEVVK